MPSGVYDGREKAGKNGGFRVFIRLTVARGEVCKAKYGGDSYSSGMNCDSTAGVMTMV